MLLKCDEKLTIGDLTSGMNCTVLVLRMANTKWKETKQQLSMLPGPAEPGCCLVSFHFLWAILSTSTVYQSNIKGPNILLKWVTK